MKSTNQFDNIVYIRVGTYIRALWVSEVRVGTYMHRKTRWNYYSYIMYVFDTPYIPVDCKNVEPVVNNIPTRVLDVYLRRRKIDFVSRPITCGMLEGISLFIFFTSIPRPLSNKEKNYQPWTMADNGQLWLYYCYRVIGCSN